ncbi:uncharacterized protein LOC119073697 [Bradysia coprophila]|uniref:uncharacterized protein LOC119073697 n=1 Tax=Bradysia coprophila TaxID=38358 RepID=UPI00187D793F|nr:uncharacterized protein LOC119073697 [Bradysia coprophila]
MATAVYGGSPRHHSRIMVSGNVGTPNIVTNSNTITTHHHLPNALQQSTPIISATLNQSSNIIFPPTSYISSSNPPTISSNHFAAHTLMHHHNAHRLSKRKSAVELLAESKPFYVKSETVLDRQQQLNYRSGNSTSSLMSPSRTPLPHQRSSSITRRSGSANSDILQTKLRSLLNTSTENKDSTPSDVDIISKFMKPDSPNNYDINKYMSPKKLNQELTVLPDPNCDVSVFFPSAFLSPQSLPPHPASDDDIYSYGIDDSLLLTDDYQTISPPAEYAENTSTKPYGASNNRYAGYQRSYSHSQAVASDEAEYSPSYNINSHKSLPDLHSQISRHSPHSEALSCCSRGNRSNKSGSSFNRDSGGSSGHYTHRSEPCCKQQPNENPANTSTDYRRDSGSSTQHSGNSYYAYGLPQNMRYDCMECRAKLQNDANCLLNFTTPEVPEAFQDDYDDKSRGYYEDRSRPYYKNPQMSPNQKTPPESLPPIIKEPELSPPLGTFKRQRCFRIKQRSRYSSPNDRNSRSEDDRKPILRSKSDISDRYWQRNAAGDQVKSLDKRGKMDSVSQLERFFDRLGMNDDKYEEFIAPKLQPLSDSDSDHSSPVFFSDASTVDSTRLPDSTETNQNTQAYRPSEPPSIVERNARIIKWLCNCRKLQLQFS